MEIYLSPTALRRILLAAQEALDEHDPALLGAALRRVLRRAELADELDDDQIADLARGVLEHWDPTDGQEAFLAELEESLADVEVSLVYEPPDDDESDDVLDDPRDGAESWRAVL